MVKTQSRLQRSKCGYGDIEQYENPSSVGSNPIRGITFTKEISSPSRGVPLLHATLLCGHKLRCKCGYNTGISVQARVFISSLLNWRRSMPGINPIGRDDWLKPNTVRVQIPYTRPLNKYGQVANRQTRRTVNPLLL